MPRTRIRALRRLAAVLAVAGTLLTGLQPATAAPPATASPPTAAAPPATAQTTPEDSTAATYYKALQLNTPFVETTWDATAGTYRISDFYVVSVLGNAVLLKYGRYDEQATGTPRATLRDHTLRSIRYAAAHDRNVDPAGTWGRQIYWDSTMESYFVAAAKLMWDDLDATTRRNVDTIIRGTADYVTSLGTGDDPLSGGWTTNGLEGSYAGDTKMEEMGTRTMPLATALAWLPEDPHAATWRAWLGRWTRNMSGLPAADRANPLLKDNRAHNIWDSFLVENHGSWASMYQQSIGAYPGRNSTQFVLAGRPVPADVTTVPSDDRLWETMGRTGTDAGVPEDFMVADRHHLYGRDVMPIAYRAVVARDPYAARAERMLAEHLLPYVRYAPSGRLTKFSGEPKYEPEARAEIAMAYLLHLGSDRLGGAVTPVSEKQYFAGMSAATDYGSGPGLTAQQSRRALAAAVTKPGYTKFAYVPQHDDWFLDVSGANPAFLPSVNTPLRGRSTHTYATLRDGLDATATTVRTPAGAAGFTTLPDGSVVYASSGIGAGEGELRLHNLDMPGVPGLDGDRTFTWAGGSATRSAAAGLGDGGTDEVAFPATTARYVRMSGTKAATQYGFSLYELEAYGPDGASNLALGKTATASSYDAANKLPPELATDGKTDTRWAVAPAERPDPGWLSVDLGARRRLDKVVLRWESAYASRYRIEVSDDGRDWRTVSEVPTADHPDGDWLNVDGRAGFVVRHGGNPMTVLPTSVTLSDGPAAGSAGMVIEGHPAETPAQTAAHAAAKAPSDLPAGMSASLAGGQLSVFNLGDEAVRDAEFTVPHQGRGVVAYQGTQRTTGDRATRYTVSLDAADAQVRAARFAVTGTGGRGVPAGLTLRADGSRTLRLAAESAARVRVRSLATGQVRVVSVPAGGSATAAFTTGPDVPVSDLARGRTTFPTTPLPPGMTSPARAVDGDRATAWRPGGDGGRMVVDLGSSRALSEAVLTWAAARAPGVRIEVSADGEHYTAAGTADPAAGRTQHVPLTGEARYVAVDVPDGAGRGPGLADLAVLPGGG